MSFTGNSALSGFAEGFANVFGQQQHEKRLMEHQFSTEMFKAMLDHPEYAQTDAGKRVLKSFGPAGEDASNMFIDAVKNARNNPILAKILSPDVGGADATGGAAPQRTDQPIVDTGQAVDQPPMWQPTPGVPTMGTAEINVPGVGKTNVDFSKLSEREKEAGFTKLKTWWGDKIKQSQQQNGWKSLGPEQDDLDATLNAVHTLNQRAGGPDAIPQSIKKLLDDQAKAHAQAIGKLNIEGSPQALKLREDQAAATARGREKVTGPKTPAEHAFTAADMNGYEFVDRDGNVTPIKPGDTREKATAKGLSIRQKAGWFGYGTPGDPSPVGDPGGGAPNPPPSTPAPTPSYVGSQQNKDDHALIYGSQ